MSNAADSKLKTLFVHNIGPNVSSTELVQLFGLDITDVLKQTTRIGITHGKNGHMAIIDIIEGCHKTVLDMNGVSFKGRELTITDEEKMVTSYEISDVLNDETRAIQYMQVNCRFPEWNFNQVTDMEIADALDEYHEDDPTKSVEDLGWFKKSLQDF